MPNYPSNYKVANHTRFNDGTSSDLSQVLATHPGWLLGIQAFSISTVTAAFLFIYDTTAAVTTVSVPLWQGVVPSAVTPGSGFTLDLANGIALSNGLAYCLSSGSQSTATSTYPANTVKVDIQFVTSSCL